MIEEEYKRLCEENDKTILDEGRIEPRAILIHDGRAEVIKLPVKKDNHATVQKAVKSYVAKKEKLEGYILILDTIPSGKMKVELPGVKCCFRIMYAPRKKLTSGVWYRKGKIFADDKAEGRNALFIDKWDYWA